MRPFYLFPSILLTTGLITAKSIPQDHHSIQHQQQPPNNSAPHYQFNATSTQNIAVYFGRTNATANTTLLAQCLDPNIDIVILAFVTQIQGPGGYPRISFDNLCDGNRTAAMRAANATGLVACMGLADQIGECQGLGKKVLLGIGGQAGNVSFADEDDAVRAAGVLWDVFGAGEGEGVVSGLRPFGNVTVDGFDIDNETGDGTHYSTFITTLRNLSQSQTQPLKTYYLSAAPTCRFPDPSQPLSMLTLLDFIWPQFYSAPSCNIGSSGFAASFSGWSERLASTSVKLYLGAPAFAAAVGKMGGYQEPDDFAGTVEMAAGLAGPKVFGGVMLWDGAYAHVTRDGAGRDFLNVTKEALVQANSGSWRRPARKPHLMKLGLFTGISGLVGLGR